MLNMNSESRRASKQQHKKMIAADISAEMQNENDVEAGNPLVLLMYEFLTVPGSSKVAYFWALTTCWMVIVRILAIGLESCDGPNQYYNRPTNNARFKFLLTESEYWAIYIAVMVPLVIDTFARVVTLAFVCFGDENAEIFEILKSDKLEIFLFTSDVVGVIPFFIRAVYIHPHDVPLTQGSQLVLTMMELMIIGRILRVIKDIPAIRAIRIALSKSAGHLVLPLFFFFLFNITAAVFLYFAEPCYDFNTCPWKNLFDTSFFSTVTMTTTGYGNQVPTYELGRFIACCVMIFGSLFLSMPLAIIGNEYDKAWFDITEEVKLREQMKATEEEEIREALLKRKMPLSLDQYGNGDGGDGQIDGGEGSEGEGSDDELVVSDPVKELLRKEEEQRAKKEADDAIAAQSIVMITHSSLMDIVSQLKSECKLICRVNPVILMRYCELRAWLPALSQHVSHIYDMVLQEKSAEITAAGHVVGGGPGGSAPRRGSVFGPRSSTLPTMVEAGGGGGGAGGPKKSLTGPSSHPSSVHPAPPAPISTARGTVAAPSLGSSVVSPSQMLMNNRKPGGGGKKESDSEEDEEDEDDENGSDDSDHKGRNRKNNNNKNNKANKTGHRRVNQHDDDEDAEEEAGPRKQGEMRDSDLPPHLRRQQSMIQKMFPPPTNRKSLYAKVLKAIGVDGESDMRRRSVSEDFLSRMEQISSNPTTLRSRIWILLELPHSSKEARLIQLIIIFLIAVSIFLLYTQTITKLTHYGPDTAICGELLSLYCEDKGMYNHTTLDPGCYVQYANGTISNEKVKYSCEGNNCFGHGYNFGSQHSNLSCVDNGLPQWVPPFQTKEQLIYKYDTPNLFSSRADMHRINPICSRIECGDADNTESEYVDANFVWIVSEFTINLIFSVELILRVAVSESVWIFFKDKMNVLDILAVMPFYIELFNTVATGSFSNLDFSILASSPQPIFIVTMRSLKVFRMFKLTRHFQASKVLSETATTVWKQILGMLALMAFFVVLFAIFLFLVEGGTPCFVGDVGCVVPDSIIDTVHIGDRILVNKNGDISQFGNVFFGVWFSFVTITTTGYGDIVPVTNIGQVMAIFLMISGIFYMAMPLTAAASTFYNVHEKYQIKIGHVEANPEPEEKKVVVHEDPMDWKLKLTIKNLIGELFVTSSGINETFKDMQSPVEEGRDGPTMAPGNRKQSQMLKTIVRQINNLERSLSNAESHLKALVLAHHYYMKKANAHAALMAKEIEVSRSSMPAIGNSAEQRKASRKQE